MESGVYALLGVLVGALPVLFNSWRERKAQEKRHLRELAVEMALGEFRAHMEVAQMGGGRAVHPPLTYLATSLIAVEELMDGNIRWKDLDFSFAMIAEKIQQAQEASKEYCGSRRRQREEE